MSLEEKKLLEDKIDYLTTEIKTQHVLIQYKQSEIETQRDRILKLEICLGNMRDEIGSVL